MPQFKQPPGKIIKAARQKKNLTQQQLVDKLNKLVGGHDMIERTMISRWEKDLHFPRQKRKEALEAILNVKLGNSPPRLEQAASYIKDKEELQERLMAALQGCSEFWVTSAYVQSGVWQGNTALSQYFEKLRRSESCVVREIVYLQTLGDITKLRELAGSRYPRYRLNARIVPGQPLPLFYIPDRKFGVMLSGFGDDIRSVGLELSGSLANFIEDTYRYRWIYSTEIIDGVGKIQPQNIKKLTKLIKEIGGSTAKLTNIL